MIAGIGVDIAETSRIERLAERYGDRFVERILTPSERAEFERRGRPVNYLATRFAAKEAVAKALGTGIGKQLSFQSIEIKNDAAGRPLLKLLDGVDRAILGRDDVKALLSISDERRYAVAMVVLEA